MIFLELFIMKQWQFPCILGSGGDVGEKIQQEIACNPWRVTYR